MASQIERGEINSEGKLDRWQGRGEGGGLTRYRTTQAGLGTGVAGGLSSTGQHKRLDWVESSQILFQDEALHTTLFYIHVMEACSTVHNHTHPQHNMHSLGALWESKFQVMAFRKGIFLQPPFLRLLQSNIDFQHPNENRSSWDRSEHIDNLLSVT